MMGYEDFAPIKVDPSVVKMLEQHRDMARAVDDITIFGRVRTEEERRYKWRSLRRRVVASRVRR